MTRRTYGALPGALKRCIQAVALATLLSGIAWLALRYAARGWIGEVFLRSGESWLLKFHGAAAMLALVALGALLSTHILPGLETPHNRTAGIVLLTGTAMLGATGWGLYYLGNESLRSWTSALHIAVGLAAAAAFVHHIRYRKAGKGDVQRRVLASRRSISRS